MEDAKPPRDNFISAPKQREQEKLLHQTKGQVTIRRSKDGDAEKGYHIPHGNRSAGFLSVTRHNSRDVAPDKHEARKGGTKKTDPEGSTKFHIEPESRAAETQTASPNDTTGNDRKSLDLS